MQHSAERVVRLVRVDEDDLAACRQNANTTTGADTHIYTSIPVCTRHTLASGAAPACCRRTLNPMLGSLQLLQPPYLVAVQTVLGPTPTATGPSIPALTSQPPAQPLGNCRPADTPALTRNTFLTDFLPIIAGVVASGCMHECTLATSTPKQQQQGCCLNSAILCNCLHGILKAHAGIDGRWCRAQSS